MSEQEKVAATSGPAGIGVFCHVILAQPNTAGPDGHASGGFYVWVGTRCHDESSAQARAKSFLMSGGVVAVEIEETVMLDEADFEGPDTTQELGGRAYYGD